MRSNAAIAFFFLAAVFFLVIIFAFPNWVYTILLPAIMTLGFIFDVLLWPVLSVLVLILLYFMFRRFFRF